MGQPDTPDRITPEGGELTQIKISPFQMIVLTTEFLERFLVSAANHLETCRIVEPEVHLHMKETMVQFRLALDALQKGTVANARAARASKGLPTT